jgi:hypothetical protein
MAGTDVNHGFGQAVGDGVGAGETSGGSEVGRGRGVRAAVETAAVGDRISMVGEGVRVGASVISGVSSGRLRVGDPGNGCPQAAINRHVVSNNPVDTRIPPPGMI